LSGFKILKLASIVRIVKNHEENIIPAYGTAAFPDNFFFFIHSLLTPDSKSASGEKETGLPGMSSGFHPPEYAV